MNSPTLPSFDDLPLDKSGPLGNAWGLWGKDDELGMLNRITPATIRAAASKIQGSSTQWDGFRQYGYQDARRFYGGHKQGEFEPGTGPLGIDVFANKGRITRRRVLFDWYSWAKRSSIRLSPFENGAVELSHLEAIISENDIIFRPADILSIRVGFTAEYDVLSLQEQQSFPDRKPGGLLGLEATRESLRWIWENQFSAIASDAAGFERGPATGPYNDPDISIHQWCLAGWGLPLGELFDLEELAEQCRSRNRWTFFLQSMPLKIPGGVASPANAVAIL